MMKLRDEYPASNFAFNETWQHTFMDEVDKRGLLY